MTKERYCSYEVARLLKEKGFNEPVRSLYLIDDAHSNAVNVTYTITYRSVNSAKAILRPTHQMACDWLMEKDIYISPKYSWFRSRKGAPHYEWKPVILRLSTFNIIYPQLLDMCEYYKTYGEAVDAAIKYSLENLI